MRYTASRRSVALALLFASSAACTLTTALDGLSGGSDAPKSDRDAAQPEVTPSGGDATTDVAAEASDAAAASGYREVVLADSPLAYWRLEGTALARVGGDELGAHSGTVSGTNGMSPGAPGALAGPPSTAVSFLGNGFITVGDAFDFPARQPFSWEVWARPAAFDASYRRLLSKELTEPASQGYELEVGPSGQVSFAMMRNGSRADIYGTIPVGVYSHVVVVFDGAEARLFLDGVLANRVADPPVLADTTAPLTLGAASYSQDGFNGALDEIAVYGTALSAQRIQAHFAAARAP